MVIVLSISNPFNSILVIQHPWHCDKERPGNGRVISPLNVCFNNFISILSWAWLWSGQGLSSPNSLCSSTFAFWMMGNFILITRRCTLIILSTKLAKCHNTKASVERQVGLRQSCLFANLPANPYPSSSHQDQSNSFSVCLPTCLSDCLHSCLCFCMLVCLSIFIQGKSHECLKQTFWPC